MASGWTKKKTRMGITYKWCPIFGGDEHLLDLVEADKAGRLMILPCEAGAHLWRITYPYRQQPKITEYVVRNFRTVTKKHKLQLEVRAVGVPISNWMYYDDFYTTQEEASAALFGENKKG